MDDMIRRLCAKHWNPIGVPMRRHSDVSGPQMPWFLPEDEYDRYLEEAVRMIQAGKTDAEVIDYLGTVEIEYLGLTSPHGDKRSFVERLRGTHTRRNPI